MALTLTPLPKIPIIHPGNDLVEITLTGLKNAGLRLQDGDILVLAQKIVSKSEGRFVNLASLKPSQAANELATRSQKDARFCELILQESREILRVREGTIIVVHRLGFVCANAGIDHSNVAGTGNNKEEWVLLLPKNPNQSIARYRHKVEAATATHIGAMIIDSHGRAWRMGVVGTCIGLSGLPGLVDLRGQPDLFGYTLRITQIGVADELAAAASLIMGQAAERTPIIHARGFPYPLREGTMKELLRPKNQDLFR